MLDEQNIEKENKRLFRPLKPLKRKLNIRHFSFDIETSDENRIIDLFSVIGDDYEIFIPLDIKKMREEFFHRRYRGAVLSATNLQFDFLGIFRGSADEGKYRILSRGTAILCVTTYINNFNYDPNPENKGSCMKLKFVDSLNYASLSVEKMGEKLGIPKLEKPSFLGERPKNKDQWDELIKYNIRDSTITHQFMKMLFDKFIELGARPKLTIAATALDLFRRKYMHKVYRRPKKEDTKEMFKCFYGGRTEVFKRGMFNRKLYLHDVRSMYPSIMKGALLPDPNTHRVTYANTNRYIMDYEGTSDVSLYCPYMKIPFLPMRQPGGKVRYRCGNLRGWYTHAEIRHSLKYGYVITKVHKSHYFLEKENIFHDYVNDLWTQRLEYEKKDDSCMSYVIKILLNSLFGKFATKFFDRTELQHIKAITKKDIDESESIQAAGDYRLLRAKENDPAPYCIPIWSAYISGLARIKLYEYLVHNDPIYCDTDSIVCDHVIEDINELGRLQVQSVMSKAIFCRPKMYAYIRDDDIKICKIKGLPVKVISMGGEVKLSYEIFNKIISGEDISYKKFTKYRESVRTGRKQNELYVMSKHFGNEDDKRCWPAPFSLLTEQDSEPYNMVDAQRPSNFDISIKI